MMKKWLAAMLGAAAMAISAGALAQRAAETGWYVGGSIGQASLEDEEEMSWRIAAGYRVSRTFGVEVGYANLSDFGFGGDDVTSMEVVATAGFPIANRFSLYGLLGMARLEADDESENELTFGFGAQYDFSPNVGLRAQWQRYNTDEEIDVLSIGIVYKF
jgi:OOP family OmpA-OmpF porin